MAPQLPSAHRARGGFTLIELMIVVVVIGILAAIAIPKFNQVSKAAKEAEALGILKQIRTLQERHRQAEDVYVTNNIALLEGGATIGADADYYTFTVIPRGATGYCAVATSNDTAIAAHQSMNENGVFFMSATCT